MKKVLILIAFVLSNSAICSQILDLSEKSINRLPLKYVEDIYQIGYSDSNDVLAGLVGKEVYYESDECTIVKFLESKNRGKGDLVLNCSTTKVDTLGDFDQRDLYIKGGLENLENWLKKLDLRIMNNSSFYDLNGEKVNFIEDEILILENVNYCKLSKSMYGICVETNNGVFLKYENDIKKLPVYSFFLKGLEFQKIYVKSDTLINKSKSVNNNSTDSLNVELGLKDGLNDERSELSIPILNRVSISEQVNQNGRLVFNLCINHDGKVVEIVYNKSYSTITDMVATENAMKAIKGLVFEKDLTGQNLRCGKKTFVFKGY